jgi:hydroxymethylpyrimidine/phosphomethylpyrimidine kinase
VIARVLIIAGSDSGGAAGIQADIKTVTALGGFAMTAVTAITVQNTRAVSAVHEIPRAIVAGQVTAVLSDLGADVIKTGMMVSREVIEGAHEGLVAAKATQPRVVDPVMVASSGARLLKDDAIAALLRLFVHGAALITPNLPEAEVLTGRTIRTLADMDAAVPALRALGAKAVLLKGGHVEGDLIRDVLIEPESVTAFEDSRIETKATHGTGCTTASAVAVGLAQGLPLPRAVARARAYVRQAILTAPGLGEGHGPLNHGHTIRPFDAP